MCVRVVVVVVVVGDVVRARFVVRGGEMKLLAVVTAPIFGGGL